MTTSNTSTDTTNVDKYGMTNEQRLALDIVINLLADGYLPALKQAVTQLGDIKADYSQGASRRHAAKALYNTFYLESRG